MLISSVTRVSVAISKVSSSPAFMPYVSAATVSTSISPLFGSSPERSVGSSMPSVSVVRLTSSRALPIRV